MKIGLALAGGGAKGAFHIGVWRALYDLGLDKKISAVSGTSIGAITAAFFLDGNLHRTKEAWKSISFEQIGYVDIIKILNKKMAPKRDNTVKFIRKNINLLKISKSDIDFFVGCTEVEQNKAKYFKINKNNLSPEEIIDILLASSAIPDVFEEVVIDGKKYSDGYKTDNLTLKPLCEAGCDLIISVSLNHEPTKGEIKYIENLKNKYPNVNIITIRPKHNLNGENKINLHIPISIPCVPGEFDFTSNGAIWRLNHGYVDTIREINDYLPSLIKEKNKSKINTNSSIINTKNKVEIMMGDYMKFGRYHYEDILWQVINKDDDRLLLLSTNIVEYKEFGGYANWKNSSIREFLNNEYMFLRDFTDTEKSFIIPVDNQYLYGDAPYEPDINKCLIGYDESMKRISRNDKVFILSMKEVVEFLKKKNLPYTIHGKSYWLRDFAYEKMPTYDKIKSECYKKQRIVKDNARISRKDYHELDGIRPAIYIKKFERCIGKGSIYDPYIL